MNVRLRILVTNSSSKRLNVLFSSLLTPRIIGTFACLFLSLSAARILSLGKTKSSPIILANCVVPSQTLPFDQFLIRS